MKHRNEWMVEAISGRLPILPKTHKNSITEHEDRALSSQAGQKKQIHEIKIPKECTVDAERHNKLLWYPGGVKHG